MANVNPTKLPFFINPMKMNLDDNIISYSYQKQITFNNISIKIKNIKLKKSITISLKFFKKIVDNRNYIIDSNLLYDTSIEDIAYNCLNKDESITITNNNGYYSFFKTITFNNVHIKSSKLEYTKSGQNLSLKFNIIVSLIYNRNFENIIYTLEKDDIEKWTSELNDSYIPTFVINNLNKIPELVRNLNPEVIEEVPK